LAIKSLIVTAIKEVEGTEEPMKRVRVDASAAELKRKTVADFFTSSSRLLFERLGADDLFLEKDPATWRDDESYLAGKARVSALSVVNDRAERGVALMQQYTTWRSRRTRSSANICYSASSATAPSSAVR
jgi:hypothetical protein